MAAATLAAALVFAWFYFDHSPSNSGESEDKVQGVTSTHERRSRHEPRERGSCRLDILASDMEGAPVEGVEHCAYELSTGARVACARGGTDGRTLLAWSCVAPSKAVLYSASADWVASRAKLVSPTPEQDHLVQVRLTRAGSSLLGRVEDALGGPIDGAFVGARCRSSSNSQELGGGLAQSDAAGDFELRVPVHCEVSSLNVSAHGYAAAVHPLDHARDHILVRLFPAGQIRGVVLRDSQPVSGVTVALRGAGSSDLLPAEAQTTSSGARGEFSFESVPPGRWVVSASLGQFFGTSTGPVLVGIGEVETGVDITLRQGVEVRVEVDPALAEACEEGLITVTRAEPPFTRVAALMVEGAGMYQVEGAPSHALVARFECNGFPGLTSPPLNEIGHHWKPSLVTGWVVAGQVVDVEGKGVDGAHVWLKGQAGRGPLARTDELGHFRLRGVQDGPARVWASATKSSPRTSESVEIDGEDIKGLTIELPGGVEVRGRLLSRGDQRGLTAYSVEVQGSRSSCETASDESGAFACWLDAEQGEAIEVVVEDHLGQMVENLPGVAGEAIEVELASWELEGEVEGPGEEGPYQISVEAEVEGRRRLVPIGVLSDSSGQFTLSGLSPGVIYWLSARSISGNRVSAGPYSQGDRAKLELEALAQLELLAPCPGEAVEVRVSKSAQSHFPRLVFSTVVPDDKTIGPFNFPAGTWHVELVVGANHGVGEMVTLESAGLGSVNLESCGAAKQD